MTFHDLLHAVRLSKQSRVHRDAQRCDDGARIEHRSIFEFGRVVQSDRFVSLSFVVANEMAIQWKPEEFAQRSSRLSATNSDFRAVIDKESEFWQFGASRSRLRLTPRERIKYVPV